MSIYRSTEYADSGTRAVYPRSAELPMREDLRAVLFGGAAGVVTTFPFRWAGVGLITVILGIRIPQSVVINLERLAGGLLPDAEGFSLLGTLALIGAVSGFCIHVCLFICAMLLAGSLEDRLLGRRGRTLPVGPLWLALMVISLPLAAILASEYPTPGWLAIGWPVCVIAALGLGARAGWQIPPVPLMLRAVVIAIFAVIATFDVQDFLISADSSR